MKCTTQHTPLLPEELEGNRSVYSPDVLALAGPLGVLVLTGLLDVLALAGSLGVLELTEFSVGIGEEDDELEETLALMAIRWSLECR